jgi:hypothetical protein
MLFFKKTTGNQAVRRLIQARLRVGQPENIYEHEADRVADRLMRMSEPGGQSRVGEEETIQTKEAPGRSSESTPDLALKGGGHPLQNPSEAYSSYYTRMKTIIKRR